MKQRLVRQQECGHQDQPGVGFVDSAREKNKARAVAEIYLNQGRQKLFSSLFDTTKTKIENRKSSPPAAPSSFSIPCLFGGF